MNLLPDVWGRGALFAYSALEGENTFSESVCGQLMAEHIGMMFDGNQSELYLRLKGIPWVLEIEFSLVATDLIEGKLSYELKGEFGGGSFKFLALDQRTVVGYAPSDVSTPIFKADLAEEKEFDGGKAYYVKGLLGMHWYAFATCEKDGKTYFAVVRDNDYDKAVEGVNAAFSADIDSIADKRREYFKIVPTLKNATEAEQKTLAKCFTVMKSQFHSPEGLFTDLWTTPDRLPHRRWWLWDSVFHSIGNYYIDPELAFLTIRSIIDMQKEDGFIPHMCEPNKYIAPHSQPPLIAWGVWKLYERTGKKEWLEAMYECNARFLKWMSENRDMNHNHMYQWYVEKGSVVCRGGESGMDNTPRFDNVLYLDAIDLSCYMANEMRYMVKIANTLGKEDDAACYEAEYKIIKDRINEVLYDSEDKRYYDRLPLNGEFKKVATVSSFLPLFAGVCTEEQAKALADDLSNPETFMGEMPVPTVAFNDPTHSIDYWRGTTWICYNYMIQEGLRNYGYTELADEIVDKTIRCIAEWYEREGCIFEVYDPRNRLCPSELERKGPALKPIEPYARILAVRDFGWSSTLYTAMIMDRERKTSITFFAE